MQFKYAVLKKLSAVKTTAYAGVNQLRSGVAAPYSRLFYVNDDKNWVLNWEVREIKAITDRLGIPAVQAIAQGIARQAIFFSGKYVLRQPERYLH